MRIYGSFHICTLQYMCIFVYAHVYRGAHFRICMLFYMSIYTEVYICESFHICAYIRKHAYIEAFVYVHTQKRAYTEASVYACFHVWAHTKVSVCVYFRIYAGSTHIQKILYMCTSMYGNIWKFPYMQIYRGTHIHKLPIDTHFQQPFYFHLKKNGSLFYMFKSISVETLR